MHACMYVMIKRKTKKIKLNYHVTTYGMRIGPNNHFLWLGLTTLVR